MNPGDVATTGGRASGLDWVRHGANFLGFRSRPARHRVPLAPLSVPEQCQGTLAGMPGWMVAVRVEWCYRGSPSIQWFLVAERDRAKAAAMAREAAEVAEGAVVEFSRDPIAAHTLRHLEVLPGTARRWEAGECLADMSDASIGNNQ